MCLKTPDSSDHTYLVCSLGTSVSLKPHAFLLLLRIVVDVCNLLSGFGGGVKRGGCLLFFCRGHWCYRLWDTNPAQGHKFFTLHRLTDWPGAKCHTVIWSGRNYSLSQAQNKPVMILLVHNIELMHAAVLIQPFSHLTGTLPVIYRLTRVWTPASAQMLTWPH